MCKHPDSVVNISSAGRIFTRAYGRLDSDRNHNGSSPRLGLKRGSVHAGRHGRRLFDKTDNVFMPLLLRSVVYRDCSNPAAVVLSPLPSRRLVGEQCLKAAGSTGW